MIPPKNFSVHSFATVKSGNAENAARTHDAMLEHFAHHAERFARGNPAQPEAADVVALSTAIAPLTQHFAKMQRADPQASCAVVTTYPLDDAALERHVHDAAESVDAAVIRAKNGDQYIVRRDNEVAWISQLPAPHRLTAEAAGNTEAAAGGGLACTYGVINGRGGYPLGLRDHAAFRAAKAYAQTVRENADRHVIRIESTANTAPAIPSGKYGVDSAADGLGRSLAAELVNQFECEAQDVMLPVKYLAGGAEPGTPAGEKLVPYGAGDPALQFVTSRIVGVDEVPHSIESVAEAINR